VGKLNELNVNQVELFIFDMDGLLLDSERIAAEFWADGLQLDRVQLLELYRSIIGKTDAFADQYLSEMFPNLDVEEFSMTVSEKLMVSYQENGIPLKEGVLALLNLLKERRIKMCVATSTVRKRALYMLERAGIIDYFDGIFCGDMVENSKPDPEIFLLAARHFNIAGENCLILEDSPVGVLAATKAGIRVVLIPDIIEPDQQTLDNATAQITSLEELLPYLSV